MALQELLVDLAAGADSWKRACRVVAVSNITLSGEQTIDSIAVVEGERVLATAQTTAGANGPWVVQLGSWTRPADFDASSKIVFGARFAITSGTVYASTVWELTSPVSGQPVLGVTALVFAEDESSGVTLSSATPQPIGEEANGVATDTLPADHVHQIDGLVITAGADNAPVVLSGKNADRTTTKPVVFEVGSGGDVSSSVQLRDGGAPFLSLRRWTPGAENECQFIGGTLDGTVTEHFLFVCTKFVVQPITNGDIEFNAPQDVYLSHGLGRDIFHREAMDLVGGQPFTVIREHLDLDGATLLELADGPTSFSITGVQDTVGAGMSFTFRAPKGKAGSVGGACVIGAGDGGTAGTNAPGLCSINTGTPVSNVGGKFALAHEDATKWLEFVQSAASTALVSGGPQGAETHTIIVRGTAVNIESSADHVALTPNGDLYLGHGSASAVIERYGGEEMRRIRRGTAQSIGAVNADIITFALPDNQVTRLVVDVEVSNDTDNEGGGFSTLTVFYRRSGAGAPVLIGAAVGGVGQLDATIAAATVAVVISGNDAIVRGAGVAAKTIQWSGELVARRVRIT